MSKWIAEFDLEDGDKMPEHMEVNFKGAKIDFYCRPKEPILDKTREEAIENLKILKEEYWDDDGYGHETKQYDDTMLALDMAIEALEQEPILDKIRAEIQQIIGERNLDDYDFCSGLIVARKIIDKYKKESEEMNENNK